MSKIKLSLADPATRAVWAAVKRAKVEVASWPAWKRGDLINVARWTGSRRWHIVEKKLGVNHVATACRRGFMGNGGSMEHMEGVDPADVDLCGKCRRGLATTDSGGGGG